MYFVMMEEQGEFTKHTTVEGSVADTLSYLLEHILEKPVNRSQQKVTIVWTEP